MGYVFVGERRSPTAQRMGVHWEDGRLCASNLHAALRRIGIEPADHTFRNLWTDDGEIDQKALTATLADSLGNLADEHTTIVALGKRVSRELSKWSVPHLMLVHPAARGSIRKRERYQAHVESVMAQNL